MIDHVAPLSVKVLAAVLKQAAQWAEWEAETISDVHDYAQRFGGEPGANVYQFVLADALRLRGLTPERFHARIGAGE